jgi:hypothetical protein
MRVPYYCPHCDQRSTRRWNLDVHIKRRHGSFLSGRYSGQYKPDNPFWDKRNNPYHNSATVADSVADTFQLRNGSQQSPQVTSQYYTSPIYRPSADDQNYGTLCQQTKLEELKRLVYKYSKFHTNDPDEIMRLVAYYCINGDYKFLDDKLEQLRSIDRLANLRF